MLKLARSTIVLTALILLGLPTAAQAARRRHHHIRLHKQHHSHKKLEPTPREALSVALQKSHELWGIEPCKGHYRVETNVPLPEGLGGEAEWESPTGVNNYTSPPNTWTNCIMYLSPENTFLPINGLSDWPMECIVVMHEYGHLTGHTHSDESEEGRPNAPDVSPDTAEQRNVMLSGYNFETTPSPDLRRCGWES